MKIWVAGIRDKETHELSLKLCQFSFRNIKRSVYCQYGQNSLTFRALAHRQRETENPKMKDPKVKYTQCAAQAEQIYKSKYKKVGVLPIRIEQSIQFSSTGPSLQRNRKSKSESSQIHFYLYSAYTAHYVYQFSFPIHLFYHLPRKERYRKLRCNSSLNIASYRIASH